MNALSGDCVVITRAGLRQRDVMHDIKGVILAALTAGNTLLWAPPKVVLVPAMVNPLDTHTVIGADKCALRGGYAGTHTPMAGFWVAYWCADDSAQLARVVLEEGR